MKELVDAYLEGDADLLFKEALCAGGQAWRRSLFETILRNREAAARAPANLLTALETDAFRTVPEIRALIMGIAADLEGSHLRCDWPYRDEDVVDRLLFPHSDSVGGLAFIDENRIASSSEDGFLAVVDVRDFTVIACFPAHGGEPVNHLAYDPARKLLASCGDDFKIRLWETTTWTEVAVLEGHEDYVSRLAVSGNRLLSASKDQTVMVWDLETLAPLSRFRGHRDWVYGLAVSPDGREAVSCSLDNKMLRWEVETGALLGELNEGAERLSINVNGEELYLLRKGKCKGKYLPIGSTALWPRQDLLVSAGHQVAFWDTRTWTIQRLSRVLYREVKALGCAGDDLVAVSQGIVGMDAASGEESFELLGHGGAVIVSAALSPGGTLLATGDEDGRIAVRPLADLRKGGYAFGHAGRISSILPCGEEAVMTGGNDHAAVLWEAASGERLARSADFESDSGGPVHLHWLDKASGEVAITTGHELVVWNSRSRKLVRRLTLEHSLWQHGSLLRYADGFLCAQQDKGIVYTDAATGRQELLDQDRCCFGDFRLSPDGKLLLACGIPGIPDSAFTEDMTEKERERIKRREPLHAPLVLFDPAARKVVREFWHPVLFKRAKCDPDRADKRIRHHPVRCAWSPDGRHFCAAFTSGEIMAWNAATGRRVLRKRLSRDIVDLPVAWLDNDTIAAFTERGTRLAAISIADGNLAAQALAATPASTLSFSEDRRYLALGLREGLFCVYDLVERHELAGTSLPSKATAFAWEGDRLYVGTANGTLHSFTVSSTPTARASGEE